MTDYLRVKDKSTGHKYTIIASSFDPEAHQELKQDAVNIAGDPLPPEYAETGATTTSTTKKES